LSWFFFFDTKRKEKRKEKRRREEKRREKKKRRSQPTDALHLFAATNIEPNNIEPQHRTAVEQQKKVR